MRFVPGLVLFAMLAACTTATHAPSPSDSTDYLIRFQGKATEITPRLAMIINSVAVAANRHQDKVVEVTAWSAPDSNSADMHLLDLRILSIEHGLAAAGVDEKRIVRDSALAARADVDEATNAQQVKIRLIDPPPPPPRPPKHKSKPQKSKN
jgi:hypothetical protein